MSNKFEGNPLAWGGTGPHAAFREDEMGGMTDERAAEVLAAHNEWWALFSGPQRHNREVGRAIDHAVSRLRSQPPAEAKPVGELIEDGAETEEGEHFLHQFVGPHRLPEGTKVYAHPPPSAPVGVDGIRKVIRTMRERSARAEAGKMVIYDPAGWADELEAALAQQPAPVAPPGVGVPIDIVIEYLDARACYEDASRKPTSHATAPLPKHDDPAALRLREARVALDNAIVLAQQPAAVGGAMVEMADKARQLQHKFYGDGMNLHLAMMDWSRKYDALMAQQRGESR